MSSLKIVHCGIFNEKDNGNFFYGLERKITHGFIQNGHFVYNFSYRDEERCLRIFGLKSRSTKQMNLKLIDICRNIKADILLLAKAEKITQETLAKIKTILPNIKIIQWYVDHLEEKKSFFEKLSLVDTFFYANAVHLKKLSQKYTKTVFSFFPNISDNAFDKKLYVEKKSDVLLIARDHKEDNRHKFAKMLNAFCKDNSIRCNIYASLGQPTIFGDSFHQAINQSKIAINFNRDDELECKESHKLLGASDRMAQFLGCGVCTFSPTIQGFEKLYIDKEDIIYFSNPQECFLKIQEYLQDDKYKQIGEQGRIKTLKIANAKRVTKFMLEIAYRKTMSETYEWAEYIYQDGKQV